MMDTESKVIYFAVAVSVVAQAALYTFVGLSLFRIIAWITQ